MASELLELAKRLRARSADFTEANQYALRMHERITPMGHGEITKACDLFRDAADALEKAHAELEATQNDYKREYDIVARIWGQFGNPSYEQLRGHSIYDLVEETIDRTKAAECRLEEAERIIDVLLEIAEQAVDTRCCSLGILRGMNAARAFLATGKKEGR